MGTRVQPEEPLLPHPHPADDFFLRPLPTIASSGPWYRLYSTIYEPLFFSRKGSGRFDGPEQGYGMLYVGEDEYCAFIETFGRKHGARGVEEAALSRRGLARIESSQPLRLANLLGDGLVKLGADARLASGPYLMSRLWAQAIWEHPTQVDGIRYRSRHDDTRICCGLFDRSADKFTRVGVSNLLLDCPHLLAEILAHYDYGLL
ncbi:RES family NAD+ phosphorylase [Synechococcus sp. PCC 7336]|uniref:RES family NAD+ phosphorylase n=1 Tax=Synechococcus sp. PCC 7336 TaxID=195250 RepID=UPI00034C4152|nr:RES family NAD+ phosphorylase [Synechococcus sp. PCC 7336]